jgi:hypothetical protein
MERWNPMVLHRSLRTLPLAPSLVAASCRLSRVKSRREGKKLQNPVAFCKLARRLLAPRLSSRSSPAERGRIPIEPPAAARAPSR